MFPILQRTVVRLTKRLHATDKDAARTRNCFKDDAKEPRLAHLLRRKRVPEELFHPRELYREWLGQHVEHQKALRRGWYTTAREVKRLSNDVASRRGSPEYGGSSTSVSRSLGCRSDLPIRLDSTGVPKKLGLFDGQLNSNNFFGLRLMGASCIARTFCIQTAERPCVDAPSDARGFLIGFDAQDQVLPCVRPV